MDLANQQRKPPAITVGVPVYNHEQAFASALESLGRQTFPDFEVLIFDNASTDSTPDIAKDFCARDPRFRYYRQPHNKGPIPNFFGLMEASQSPYFLWRAADDYSADDFLEVLHDLLEQHADKALAVGRIVSAFEQRVVDRHSFPSEADDVVLPGSRAAFKNVHASWIYGLFRREALLEVMTPITRDYGDDPWGFDFLALAPFLLSASVAATGKTWFAAGRREDLRPQNTPPAKPPRSDFARKMAVRKQFRAIGLGIVRPWFPGPAGRLKSEFFLWRYANNHVYKFKRVIGGQVLQWIDRLLGRPKA